MKYPPIGLPSSWFSCVLQNVSWVFYASAWQIQKWMLTVTYRIADPFSSLGAFSSSSIGGPVLHPIDDWEIHFSKHKKIKKREDQQVYTLFLLRIGNKIPMKGVPETKFGAKTKGWTIQRLPHLGTHPIIIHQTQTLLHMPARFWWRDPGIAVLMRLCQYLANTEVDAHSHL